MSDEFIKKLNDNPDFTIFKKWLMGKIEELDSVIDLDSLSNNEAGEEAKVRHKALNKLYEILSPFINVREEKEKSTEEIHKAKKRFGM